MIAVSAMLSVLEQKQYAYRYIGDSDACADGFCALSELSAHKLTWVKHIAAFDIRAIEQSLALIIVTDAVPEHDTTGYNIIITANPKAAFFTIVSALYVQEKPEVGIAQSAVVLTKDIGKNVSIGHHCFIGSNVVIGDNVTVQHNVTIDCDCTIGSGTHIASGVVIGTHGFGYYKNARGDYERVPHVGGVLIGENVDIGANTCIDRGTINNTVIGDNAKIDNLCHIGHNVTIGKNVLVIAQSMLGGSAGLADNVYVAPCVAILNQVSVARNALVGTGAVVTKNVDANMVVAGVPAKTLRERGENE